ncbi:ArgP/LysG family DNA-binding transcriptional regulator [Acidipropionibacterium virtanenii]|uniref:Putative HTH-type transcriptional regulator n=1 Tax=Acidipropionibacterium virtanenii TaxID=2057246 RepID=A0A344UUR7_9ACTN|nr:ArgP/LysG family DNA-binding transcriptional regulator [Acidipropionibacterium virtanenii]AXE39015.1 putative HTH-type transcriptional regulator [Acidipropionibacterium virtanenii]
MNREHLRTLAVLLDEGSFGAAADRMQLTPSAVSQRIKALEAEAGQILVVRGRPCSATEAGVVAARLARQLDEVETEASSALAGLASRPLGLVVNADSLATWFRDVLAEAATWADNQLQVQIEDEEYSREVLQRGEAMAAVTTSARAAAGCRSRRLGVLRYIPVAAPQLLEGGDPPEDLGTLPVVEFNAKDAMQRTFLASVGAGRPARAHRFPSSEAFLAAVRAGLGWGLIPQPQLGASLTDGSLVRLRPEHWDVELFWQCWSVRSLRLARLTDAVLKAARTGLQ